MLRPSTVSAILRFLSGGRPTSLPERLHLRLVVSESCSLCARFATSLELYAKTTADTRPISFRTVNIKDLSEEIREKHQYDIPVLLDDEGNLIVKHRFSRSAFKERIEELARKALKGSEGAVDAVENLEISGCFNAGGGSSLTREGTVEMEAAVCSVDATGEMGFGAVGACSLLESPVRVAQALADSRREQDCDGLIDPMVLVGAGAEQWAKDNGMCVLDSPSISVESKKEWERVMNVVEGSTASVADSIRSMDTVGGADVDLKDWSLTAACSSGGVILKRPGRLGHCTAFGAGLWVEQREWTEVRNWSGCLRRRSVSMALTGCGEAIVRVDAAREMGRRIVERPDSVMASEVVSAFYRDHFHKGNRLLARVNPAHLYLGGVAIVRDESRREEERGEGKGEEGDEDDECFLDLLVFHNTPFLPIAWRDERGRVRGMMSKREEGREGKEPVVTVLPFFWELPSVERSTMSSDGEVSPRKRARVVVKKRGDEEEEPTSSSKSRSRPSAKASSPERKRKGGSSKTRAPIPMEERDDDEDASDVPTDHADDEEGSASRENSNADENENARYRLENDGDEDAFEIPTRDDDLLSRLKDEIGQDRWRCLYERFPAFFSLLRSPSDGPRYATSPALRNRLAHLLCLTYSKISPHLKRVLSKAASGPRTTKIDAHCRDLSDHLLMLTYLLHKLICIAEEEARTTKKKPAKKAKKPRKGKGAVVQNEEGDMSGGDDDGMGGNVEAEEENTWDDTRGKVLECLAEMANVSTQDTDGKTVESAMRFLWKNNINKSFRNTITDCALQFLRNPDITRPPARNALTLVFKLFRAICINFRQFTYTGSVLFITLTNLDYYKESGATAYPFIERIKAVGVNKDMNKLLEQMLDYFTNGQTNVSSSNAKPLCLFMSTIAEAEPFMTFQHILPFLQLLKDDNASIRSTVLNVLTVLLTQDFLDPSKVLLSERFSIARNRMFDHLLQHVRDVNANVRASALKCLTSMARAKRIPRDLIQEGLVRLVSHRISDDKVAVRKEAIRFATIFLQNNPYGHDFDRKTNEKKLKECLLKRDNIRMDGADMKSIQEAERVWNRTKDDLAKEVLEQCELELIDQYEIPTVDQRKQMYRELTWREAQKEHGGAADEEEQEEPTERDVTMRWLMTLLISEEALYKTQIQNAARLLVGMGETDQLKHEQCTKDDLNKCTSSDHKAKLLMKAGRFAFVHTAAMIMGRNEQMILEKEQEMERQKKIRRALSKDIQDMVMKLVFEREYAECLKAGMTAVLQGEGGDLKLGIEFVIKCKEFNITGAEEQVRKLCGLVWKSDEEGRQQILQAASSMFLSSNTNPRLRDAATAENILNLVKAMSDHERGSVEQVLALTTKFNPMPGGVYNLLWEQVDEDSIAKGTGKRHMQVAAMKALCLLSRSDVARNRQWLRRYQKIVQDGWPEMAAEALGCIANLATWHTKDDGNLPETRPYRIPGSDSLFKTVQRFMLTELCREEARTWNRSLRATLDIYFHICKDTQDVVAGLTSKLMWFLRRTSQALRYYDQQQTQNGAMTPRSQRNEPTVDPILKGVVVDERSKYLNRLWSVLLERLCVLASELAVRLLVHADYVFVREFIKARQYISSQKEGEPFPRRKLFAWEENSVVRRGIFDWGSDNADDVECTGLTEDERIREMARKMIDNQLVDHKQALLYRLLPIVVHSVRAKGSPRRVRFQAMNALSKIMLVSPRVAQQGARTFFAFLNNAESPVLRSNLTVVAADLTFRHPNLVENHAAALFNQLQDPDPCVRETCVLILNHLISNDLIKTHVIMAYALLGYVDTTKSIVQLTKNLFHEWSKKEGIMNHVPSFITRIAADSQKVSLEKFRRIMDEFFPLIRERKDADVQALVIKLCKRIELAKNPACVVRNPDMPAYFSYCLRQLTLNSRGFHKDDLRPIARGESAATARNAAAIRPYDLSVTLSEDDLRPGARGAAAAAAATPIPVAASPVRRRETEDERREAELIRDLVMELERSRVRRRAPDKKGEEETSAIRELMRRDEERNNRKKELRTKFKEDNDRWLNGAPKEENDKLWKIPEEKPEDVPVSNLSTKIRPNKADKEKDYLPVRRRYNDKLVDCFDQYSQYLADRRVYEDINALVVAFRETEKKNTNSDLSAEIGVFLAKMAEANEVLGAENRADVDHQKERERAERARAAASGSSVSQSATARKMRAHKAISSTAATPARGGRSKKGKRRNRYIDSDEEEEYSD
uniref:Condensin complex subunit 1 n=1 Tax=Pristionchus pacificus TaxID=54126 RepID=A0A2A6CFT6_PRIPA|eukprot:PDM76999.1 dpy-28 [Pristionchus pacificus]